VDLVINTPFGRGPRTRRLLHPHGAATAGVPCITTLPGVFAAVRGIEALRRRSSEPRSLQEHHEARAGSVAARLSIPEAAASGGRSR
jgi:carbamoyl-phosphate synthase large subunit